VRLWSEHRLHLSANFKNYDLAPDGKRFAIEESPGAAEQRTTTHVNLLLSFFDEVMRRAPVKK